VTITSTASALTSDGTVKPEVLREMARDAIHFRTLVDGCQFCEDGHPCEGCVINAMWLRQYREVLASLPAA
jgi:hypothetical protein